MQRVLVTYGSVGGNTELVCEKVAAVLGEHGIEVEMMKAEIGDPKKMEQFDFLILASPTYGHGQLEDFFERFLGKAKEVNLVGKKCAIVGLGDPKYDSDYLIESAKIIQKFCVEKEMQELGNPLRIVKSPVPHLETMVKNWAEELVKLIQSS